MLTVFLVLFTACILTHPALSLHYAALGLTLWAKNMVPALFPFLVLSSVMVGMGLTEKASMVVYPVLSPLFRVRKNVCYGMLLGFLCGFPMGAKVTAQLLEKGKITPGEGAYLLAFCNNIGPVYFLSFVLPLLGRNRTAPYLFGMYGIPLLYGLLLRYTACRDLSAGDPLPPPRPQLQVCASQGSRLLEELDSAIHSAAQSMVTLGGYMVLFNLLNLIPQVLTGRPVPLLAPLLEITGGLGMLRDTRPLYSLLAVSFGGLSCMAQTYSCIRSTGLSMRRYVFHRLFLLGLTGIFYFLWFLLVPESFLR